MCHASIGECLAYTNLLSSLHLACTQRPPESQGGSRLLGALPMLLSTPSAFIIVSIHVTSFLMCAPSRLGALEFILPIRHSPFAILRYRLMHPHF